MTDSVRAFIQELESELAKIWMQEPEDLKKLRLGIIPSGAGSFGQSFSTLVFADGEVRDLGIYCLTTIFLSADDPDFQINHLRKMARMLLPVAGEFVGYCGLEKVWQYTERYLGMLDSIDDKQELRDLTYALLMYVNRVHGWIHFYFPWGLGVLYPLRLKADVEEMAALVR